MVHLSKESFLLGRLSGRCERDLEKRRGGVGRGRLWDFETKAGWVLEPPVSTEDVEGRQGGEQGENQQKSRTVGRSANGNLGSGVTISARKGVKRGRCYTSPFEDSPMFKRSDSPGCFWWRLLASLRTTFRPFTLMAGSVPRKAWNDCPGETDASLVLVAKLLSKKTETSSLGSSR